MFPFDHSALPQLTTRKAFIGIDFQHDFIAQDGALPVPEPEGLVDRTVKLAKAFRDVGDVVWIQSQFEETRPVFDDQIIVTDNKPLLRPSSRGRAKLLPVEDLDVAGPPDAEAFLSHEEPVCVKADTPGCRIAAAIEEASQKTDTKLTKSHYSAFQTTQLLRILRAKMVMELFICGSLTNVGVHATALDAAGHGMAITIVDDCCGYRTEARKASAIASLIELTGCEVASYEEVLESLQPKPPKTPKASRSKASSQQSKRMEPSRSVKSGVDKDVRDKSLSPSIVKNMTGLRLASDSPSPAAAGTQPQTKASTTSAAERHDSEDKPPSKTEESNGVSQTKTVTKDTKQEQDVSEAAAIKGDAGKVVETKEEETPAQKTTKDEDISPQNTDKVEKETETSTPPKVNLDMARTKTPPENEEGHLLQKGLCEGDTDIIENVLPDTLVDGIFEKLRDEVQWQRMSHQGGEVPRLVAVQGEVGEDGTIPVYRHPSDESPPLLPFSPTVLAIKAETEKHLGHPLNHVLIQYYRDGTDYISEHSDKTLDIVQGSYIANVSLGAERTMVFRTKRRDKDPSRDEASPADLKRKIQRARLPHNSLCRLGLKSNMKWLHAIRQDKRPKSQKSPAELAYDGGRISLTFRQIGTFLNREETFIWGQGAKAKTQEEAHAVINGQTDEAIEMLKAFGTENHATEFDWDAHYGKGFDVLHMSNAPRLFACGDSVANMRAAFMLAEYGVNYAKGSITAGPDSGPSNTESGAIKFTDKDKSAVQGDLAVMLYLDARYGLGKPGSTARSPKELATQFTRFQRAMSVVDAWRSLPKDTTSGKRDLKSLKHELEVWDGFVAEAEGAFLAGSELSLPDFALWPVLHSIVEESGLEALEGLDKLKDYYERVGARSSAKKVLGKESTPPPPPPPPPEAGEPSTST
ncbi:hypothetical protein LCI18_011470 [Fusarium solani-melongenae]|uniref:Uncharacterized protein n=1 Tax=Fusarium solani subsp. cucurbitae TaxID=2747967 RepID=A0ACD3ZH25_FUSSC|nr:hypothetical protein LCI18_011470 [Fusarium solani-melongenae]